MEGFLTSKVMWPGLGSGHTAYHRVALIELTNRTTHKKTFCEWTGGRPALSGQLSREVDLKTLYSSFRFHRLLSSGLHRWTYCITFQHGNKHTEHFQNGRRTGHSPLLAGNERERERESTPKNSKWQWCITSWKKTVKILSTDRNKLLVIADCLTAGCLRSRLALRMNDVK